MPLARTWSANVVNRYHGKSPEENKDHTGKFKMSVSGNTTTNSEYFPSRIAGICHEISVSQQKNLEEAVQKLCKTKSFQVHRGRINVLLHIILVTRKKKTEADEFSMKNQERSTTKPIHADVISSTMI